MLNQTLTVVEGLKVGHWTHDEAATGCTVVLCPPEGCIASGLALGSAPGTRELALLAPEKMVQRVHAVLLSGGSAFGLAAATGVMDYLQEKGHGFDTAFAKVPIVPAAVIYDLSQGSAKIRPDAKAGYQAASQADSSPVETGRIGVGRGASVAKYLGFDKAVPSGLGSAAKEVQGAYVAALAVSNAVGNIVDLMGQPVAFAQGEKDLFQSQAYSNTTLVVVATNAAINKAQAYHLAQSAHIGIAQVTRPSHTLHDGDTSFVLSTAKGPSVPLMELSVAVQDLVARAILQGVRAANP